MGVYKGSTQSQACSRVGVPRSDVRRMILDHLAPTGADISPRLSISGRSVVLYISDTCIFSHQFAILLDMSSIINIHICKHMQIYANTYISYIFDICTWLPHRLQQGNMPLFEPQIFGSWRPVALWVPQCLARSERCILLLDVVSYCK